MSSLKSIADCKKELGPVSVRNGDVSFTFASVSDVLKAKEACAPMLRFCDLPMCHVQTSQEQPCCVARRVGSSRIFGG